MKLPRATEAGDISINLAPLLDVIFILLIFFVITTSFSSEQRLAITLPASETTAAPSDNFLELIIDADGQYLVGTRQLSSTHRSALKSALQQAQLQSPKESLRITADAKVPHSKVVLALDLAGELGFSQIRITTKELIP